MTGRKILLFVATGVVAVLVVAAAGYFFVQQRIKGQIEDGLRQLAADPPAPYRAIVYDTVEFSLHDRRVVVTGLKAEPGASGESVSIGRLELERFDTDVWQQAIAPHQSGAPGEGNFRRLFDKAIFIDVAADQGGQPAKAEKLVVVGFEIRPVPSQAISTLRALSATERMKEVLSYVRIETTVMEGVRAISGGRELTFARGEILGLRDGRFKSLAFDRLDQDQPDGRLTLGRFELRDGLSAVWFSPVEPKTVDEKLSYFDFSALKLADLRKGDAASSESFAIIESAEFGAANRAKFDSLDIRGITLADRTPANPISLGIANVELRDLDWEQILPVLAALVASDGKTVGGGELQTQLEKIGRLRYSLGKLSVTGMDFGPGITLAAATMRFRNDSAKGDADIDLTDLTVKAAELRDRNASAGLAGFGYSTLTLSLRMRVSGDYEAATATLETLEISGPQVGKLATSYSVSNYRQPTAGQADPMAQLLAANIDRIEISWQDDGLTQRVLGAVARQQRTSITNIRAGLVAQLRQLMLPYQNSARMRDLANALAGYLEKPGTLLVAARPAQPVPVEAVARLLDVPPGSQPDLPALFDLLAIESSTR